MLEWWGERRKETEQNKTGQECPGRRRRQVARLDRVVRVSLVQMVRSEQGVERDEGVCRSFTWGKNGQAEETVQAKALRVFQKQ